MQEKTEQESLMIRYLLGELSKEEQAQVEERFLSDGQFFEQLLAVEDALIDEYVRGTLSEYERRKVHELVTSSRYQRRQVEFARGLRSDIRLTKPAGLKPLSRARLRLGSWRKFLLTLFGPRGAGKRFALAIYLMMLAVAGAILIWNLVLRDKLGRMEAERAALEATGQTLQQELEKRDSDNKQMATDLESERKRRAEIEKELADLQAAAPDPPRDEIESIVFSSDLVVRGGGRYETVRLKPNTRLLRFQIILREEDKSQTYAAAIKNFNGRLIWQKDLPVTRPPASNSLVIVLPASLFPADGYTLTLRKRDKEGNMVDVRDYAFQVKQ